MSCNVGGGSGEAHTIREVETDQIQRDYMSLLVVESRQVRDAAILLYILPRSPGTGEAAT